VPGSPPRASWAACVSARAASRYSGTLELSQSAKSAMKSSRAKRSTFWWAGSARFGLLSGRDRASQRSTLSSEQVCRSRAVCAARSANRTRTSAAAWRKAGGQSGSAGSGQRAAQMTARQAASGRRAHQMCRVEICPWRIDFSRRAWAEIRLMGRSTSISRLGYRMFIRNTQLRSAGTKSGRVQTG
jgi:hypothetical protein